MSKSETSLKSKTRKRSPGAIRAGLRAGLWAGLGLTLIVAVGFWRPGGLLTSPGVSETAFAGAAHSAVPLPVWQKSATESEDPAATIATEPPPAPFLRNLAATLESLQAEPDIIQRAEKLDALVQALAPTDLPAAVEFLGGRSSSEFNHDLRMRLIRQWAGADPQAVADWASRLPPGPERQEAITGVAIVWANQNLSQAVEWVRQLPEGNERNGGLLSVAGEAARIKPIESLILAMETPAGEVRDDLISHAASEWAAQAPAAAAEWANQITDPALRERMVKDIATEWGESDPVAAATLALNSLTPGRQQDDAVMGVVQRWVQKQPEETAAWVAGFPEGALRDTALEELVKLWADEHLEQAGNWLNRLVPGPVRDVAVGAYVGKVLPQSPETAAHWAVDIGDEALRIRKMETVGETWLESDAAAARAWIKQAALPETSKTRLLASNSE